MKLSLSKVLKKVLMTAAGTAVTAFAVATLLTPNKIISGGATGVATLLYHMAKVPQGLTVAVFNGVLLLICLKVLGKQFVVSTIMGAGMLSVFVQLFSYLPPLTDNIILATLFGGVLYGLGVGIVFSVESSTGGMEIVSRLIQHFFPQIKVGKILQAVNIVIIAASYYVFRNRELILFSALSLFISAFTIDWFISKLNVSRIAFVITEKGEEISQRLVSSSHRGVTMLDAVGAYNLGTKQMLFCALKKSEIPEFQEKVLKLDDKAFIVYAESPEIKGKGFHLYR